MKLMIKLFFTLGMLSACSYLVHPIAGNFNDDPEQAKLDLSPAAKKILDQTFEDLDPECLVDVHVHAVGNGEENSGNWVNEDMASIFAPYKKLQFNVYLSASGISDLDHVESQYNKRLLSLLESEPRYGRIFLLAFDWHRNEKGEIQKDHSSFHIDNDYVMKVAQTSKRILPAISIHPDQPDAIEQLEKYGKAGVKLMKWLPNAMRIDPADPKHEAFYKVMKKYNITLLSHAGVEKAVEGEIYQELGNPLRLRYPLSLGLNVIGAHAASRGECIDMDDPKKPHVDCFDLFWRMFNEKKFENNFFADISGLTIHARVGKPLDVLLEHPEFHHRLMNGSDYPLPAINILYRTSQLEDLGYLSEDEADALNEIYKFNPMVFDLAMKRTLRHPKTGQKFLPSAFLIPKSLGCFKTN
ncbi:MAG: hypothetical protein COW01_06745 [Bdellovibrionales bacterium CG12_big_fil_rev_8_21_14_0_65_38_15]|nr:MAG: hypothetical protein COW79_13425 [Bdellovibrionales bacterium CG22_combo_CG10-13_8_21_14_all_38_13]PIQ55666.1 MAG: hypothetical protein COW01_06745 [Bdellovibrionales bacterium CG12_big_fil_rev_8_21_14_0_65_38_15]PIR30676.1 MAG: hypothetical protein COV38_04055 [Bdellovibrionales bacterium CG11_big_fil_rev_8_21_14_0_20_38_13]